MSYICSKSKQLIYNIMYLTPKKTRFASEQFGGLSVAQIDVLARDTPRSEITKVKGETRYYKTVDASHVVKILNEAFGFNWSQCVKHHERDSHEVRVLLELRVNTASGVIIREQFGQCSAPNKLGIGNAYKAAVNDALKKCASSLGVAFDVYSYSEDIDFKAEVAEEQYSEEVERLRSFIDKCVTPEQVEELREHTAESYEIAGAEMPNEVCELFEKQFNKVS